MLSSSKHDVLYALRQETVEAGLEEPLRVALAQAAGMEEDQSAKQEGVTRRQAIKGLVIAPQVVAKVASGTAALAASSDHALDYAQGVVEQARLGFTNDWQALRHVAAALQQVSASPEGGVPAPLTAARQQFLGDTAHMFQESANRSSVEFVAQAVVAAPAHVDLAMALGCLQASLKDAGFAFDAKTQFEAFLQSGQPPLITPGQRRAYLEPRVRPLIQEFLDANLPERIQTLERLHAFPERQVRGMTVDDFTQRMLESVEQFVRSPTRSGEDVFRGTLEQWYRALRDARWREVQAEVRQRWASAEIPASLQTGPLLERYWRRAKEEWESAPETFVSDAEFMGRLVHRLSQLRYFQGLDANAERQAEWGDPWDSEVVELLNSLGQLPPEKRAIAAREPDKLERLVHWLREERQAGLLEAVRLHQAMMTQQRAIEEGLDPEMRRWRDPETWEFPETRAAFETPAVVERPRPAAPVIPASVVAAAQQRLQAWRAWATERGREMEIRPVAWDPAAVAQAAPRGFVIYAPEPWWEALRAHLAGETPLAVNFASPEAFVPGAEGIILIAMDDEMPLPEDRPVAIRLPVSAQAVLSDEALSELALSLMTHLANQSDFRGRVILWTPESAQPLTWGQQQYLLLGAEA